MREIPEAFRERMRALPDFDFAAFDRALREDEGRRGLRVNTLKIGAAEFAAHAPFALEPSPLCPEGFLLDPGTAAGKSPYHAAGLYYLQEPSAQSVAASLGIEPGMRVLDLCAAPGGKSTHAAALLGHTGLLAANECVPSRAQALEHNLERVGARRYAVTSAMPDDFLPSFSGWFDAVIADVPCSGEGMFRREPAAAREWSPAHADACAERGKKILLTAAALVRPGGRLVFSTCTYNPAENEGAVSALLAADPTFEVVSPAVPLPPARPDWFPGAPASLARAARLMPPDTPGEGHFLAVLQKRDGDAPGTPPEADLPALTRDEAAAFFAFWEDTFSCPCPAEPRSDGRGNVFLVPEGLPALPGTRRPGIPAGTLRASRPDTSPRPAGKPRHEVALRHEMALRHEVALRRETAPRPGTSPHHEMTLRFEPSHTLFLAIPAEETRRVLAFDPDDPALAAFFAGEELSAPGTDAGYAAAAVRLGNRAFSVGFGKISGGRLKNKLPTGLRVRASG